MTRTMTRIGSAYPDRRSLLKALGIGAGGIAGAPLLAACTSQGPPRSDPSQSSPQASLLPAPEPQVKPLLDQQKVDNAVAKLDGIVQDAMERPACPGSPWPSSTRTGWCTSRASASARSASPGRSSRHGLPARVPVQAPRLHRRRRRRGRQGRHLDEPGHRPLPGFALKDPLVHGMSPSPTSSRTAAACRPRGRPARRPRLRPGLHPRPPEPGAAGPVPRELCLHQLRLHRRRRGGRRGQGDDLGETRRGHPVQPLGMNSTSYRFADYEKAPNRAVMHVKTGDGTWDAKYVRDADAQSPAGGVSSTAGTWPAGYASSSRTAARRQADRRRRGPRRTHLPEIVSQPPATPAAGPASTAWAGTSATTTRAGSAQPLRRLRPRRQHQCHPAAGRAAGHRRPHQRAARGHPRGHRAGFLDIAQNGEPTVDWLRFAAGSSSSRGAEKPKVDYSEAPADPAPARPNASTPAPTPTPTTGRWRSPRRAAPWLCNSVRRQPRTFRLTHYDGDTFSFTRRGERLTAWPAPSSPAGAGGTASSVSSTSTIRPGWAPSPAPEARGTSVSFKGTTARRPEEPLPINRQTLKADGFTGFRTLADLEINRIPQKPGIFAILRPRGSGPQYLARSTAGVLRRRSPALPGGSPPNGSTTPTSSTSGRPAPAAKATAGFAGRFRS